MESVQTKREQTAPPAPGGSSAAAAPAALKSQLRGMNYEEGKAALSPGPLPPPEVEGDAATDILRRAHAVDPSMLAADQTKAGVAKKNWAGKGQLFVNGIKAEDVHQANINDCYFVGVLSSIANSQPDYIRRIVREDGPGKYSVRFFEKVPGSAEYKQVWISVDAWLATDTSGGTDQLHYTHSKDSKDGKTELWPSIMEKAYAKFKGNYKDIDWGNTIYSYEALFGTQGARQNTTDSGTGAKKETDVWKTVTEAIDRKEPIVASTGSHVIPVLSYSTAGGKKITLRDQAATGGGKTGVKTHTLTDFCTAYTYVRTVSVGEYAGWFDGIHLAGDWTTDAGDLHLEGKQKNVFEGDIQGGGALAAPAAKVADAFQGGDSMYGNWKSNDNTKRGDFSMLIAADRKSFKGRFKGGDGVEKDWKGTRK